jgi:hypothetical protein
MRMLDELPLENGRERIDKPGQLLFDERPEEDTSHPGGNAVLVGRRKVFF